MSDTTLSFDASSSFRNSLMNRNLPPYTVTGAFSPPSGNVNYEVSPLNDSSVIDSPNDLIGTTVLANQLYPLNAYGPDGGYNNIISTNGAPLPVDSNQGEYGQDDADVVLVNEFFIDAAYIKNIYGPETGYKDLYIVTDVIQNAQYFVPYSDNEGVPLVFLPSTYTPFQILIDDNPQGSVGLLSQDSQLAQRGAIALRDEFKARIAFEEQQIISNVFQLDNLQDPFEASLVATGQQPLIGKNWKITVPENPLLLAVSFANRLTGSYFPVSPIPGDYFDENHQVLSPQTENALGVVNNLTGGLLGPILNKTRNPSEIFIANTGYGQKSVLFKSLDYNIYRPKYNKGLLLGVTEAINNLLGNNTTQGGGYYVGSDQAEPSTINSPDNEIPVDRFGKQTQAPVYGPSELAQLYEGNIDKIKFGLAGKSYTNLGGIAGQFVWLSPKYKENIGFHVKPGGDPVQPQDAEFNSVKAEFNQDTDSTEFEFKPGSILDNTQKLIESADNVTGVRRLQHVGNAINQVSKVFNDGYKEMTKGSRVVAYYDSVTNSETISIDGTEVGAEYCRVFQKDTPYLTYGDLQKTDGITESGRKFSYSIFDNTYNLNIAPLRGEESTNIKNGKVKKYMFSLENLAWRTSSEPGYTYDDLPICEKGPNGGRIMWFPPYDLKFNDSSTASWNSTSFLGRPEPIYTYKNTTRTGSLNWTVVVDHPAAMNTIIEKQLANMSQEQVDSIMDSFFAGCVKYDLYDLGLKFNQLSINELYTYQELLQNPQLTREEEVDILGSISYAQNASTGGANTIDGNANSGTGTSGGNNGAGTQETNTTNNLDINIGSVESELNSYLGFGFYFDNDYPIGKSSNLTSVPSPFTDWYSQYLGRRSTYEGTSAPIEVAVGSEKFSSAGISKFFDDVIIGNFSQIQNDFVPKVLKKALVDLEATVTLELIGSASAPAKENYNVNLSKRRNSTVENWLNTQKIGDKTVKQWRDEAKLIITFRPDGETAVIPKTGDLVSSKGNTEVESVDKDFNLASPINCTTDIKDVSLNKVTNNSQWYSIPAMACRRVAFAKIKLSNAKEPKWKCGPNNDGKCIQSKDGTFASKSECENAPPEQGGCKRNEQLKNFKCVTPGQPCQKVADGTGDYTTQEECDKNCGQISTKYACIDGKCEQSATGEFKTLEDCINSGCTPPPKPPRQNDDVDIDVKKRVKEGISKKILRKLFSECDYFEVIKITNPTVYASLKDKIKFFNPTFHSMTPEGLNARLTFLNQCVRPGQTIPVIGPDGKPKYNDARNTSFGTPPILVLRIGDFYHTKIVPNQLSITYEPLLYDINPEGIGVQPMLAKITLGFDFIGGHGLAGPVAQLQNALSFNYYANTEIYDERAVATESTKERDEGMVAKIVGKANVVPSNSAAINNQDAGEKGGSTIGNILTTEYYNDGKIMTGETEYTAIFEELSTKTNNYFTTIFNQIKKLYEVTNYPISQLVLEDRNYKEGVLNYYKSSSDKIEIIGKPSDYQGSIGKLFKQALKDVTDKNNPILKAIEDSNNEWSKQTKRDVENVLFDIILNQEAEMDQAVTGAINEIVKYQEDYIQTFKELDLVINKIDGYKTDTGEYLVYNTELIPGGTNVFENMIRIYPSETASAFTLYNKSILENKILDPNKALTDQGLSFNPTWVLFSQDTYTRRFYMVMSQTFTNDDKYNAFVDKLLTEKVKGNTDLVKLIQATCEKLKFNFNEEYKKEKEIFDKYEKTPEYEKFKKYKIEKFETKLYYTTEENSNTKDNRKLLKETYSTINTNKNKKTFNGKVTFL
jgi:hypothetical protein